MGDQPKIEDYIQYHKDGSVWAKGQMQNGVQIGYWEWFRKDCTILRSGYFTDGVQTGLWTTYDQRGEVYKITDMKDGPKTKPVTD